jgi:hypothetical protein
VKFGKGNIFQNAKKIKINLNNDEHGRKLETDKKNNVGVI